MEIVEGSKFAVGAEEKAGAQGGRVCGDDDEAAGMWEEGEVRSSKC